MSYACVFVWHPFCCCASVPLCLIFLLPVLTSPVLFMCMDWLEQQACMKLPVLTSPVLLTCVDWLEQQACIKTQDTTALKVPGRSLSQVLVEPNPVSLP